MIIVIINVHNVNGTTNNASGGRLLYLFLCYAVVNDRKKRELLNKLAYFMYSDYMITVCRGTVPFRKRATVYFMCSTWDEEHWMQAFVLQ